MGKVLAVIGAGYGSEGKGVVVNHIAPEYDCHVRVGGPNAGHSFYHDGNLFKMQQLPCGWTNPDATLLIGPGAVADLDLLLKEMTMVAPYTEDIYNRVYVASQAAILDERHHKKEGGVDGELHSRIGSTGEGVGAAREARMARDPKRIRLAKDAAKDYPEIRLIDDVPGFLATLRDSTSTNILLEGTQGSGLSLIHGPWPYVTSADTNASQIAADCGLAPNRIDEVILVARTFPIRVAGNSGPLNNELSWDEMSQILGRRVEERTTVTKKVRRIGKWDDALFERAIKLNNPSSIALMFADYIEPDDAGKTDWNELSNASRSFVEYIEYRWGKPVRFIGTGGDGWQIVDRRP